MSPGSDKIIVQQEWHPKSTCELQTFLGFAWYCRSFVKEFSQVTTTLPLVGCPAVKETTCEENTVPMDSNYKTALKTIISKLTSPPLLFTLMHLGMELELPSIWYKSLHLEAEHLTIQSDILGILLWKWAIMVISFMW